MNQSILRLTVILVLWCSLLTQGQTQSISDSVQRSLTFEEANRMFEEGNYESAARNYESLISVGPITADLLFNSANALWKTGNRGQALWRWRQARALSPTDEDILLNLNLARSELGRPPVEGDLLSLLENYASSLSPHNWAVLSLVLSYGLVGALIWNRIKSSNNQSGYGSVFVIGVLLIFMMIGASHLAWRSRGHIHDVVTIEEDAALRFGPLPESKISKRVPAGSEGRALDRKNDWIQVEFEGGAKGWTRVQNLGFVFPDSPLSNSGQ